MVLKLRIWRAVFLETWRGMRTPVYFGRQYTVKRWREKWHRAHLLVTVDDDGSIWFMPF